MRARLARVTLSLYPLAFRRRYGNEMRALLDQTPPRARDVLDLLRGALAEHLRPSAAPGSVDPADRLRASMSGVLACWVVFAAAGFGFYKTTEDSPFSAAGHAHPLLGDAHVAVQALAVVASAAVVLGALPLIVAAFTQARREHAVGRLVGLPVLPVILFTGLTGLLVLAAHAPLSHHATDASRGAFVVWGLAGLGCGAACVAASRATLFAVPLGRARLLAALSCGALVTVAMIAIACAVAVYAIALASDASGLAAGATGPFGLLSTGASLIVQVIVMALAGGLAITTTRRGWRVRSELDGSAVA